jgi:type II secretory pathway pseudopilin PulG
MNSHSSRCRQAAFSYIEVLVATLLISISLVPALEALNSGVMSSKLHTESAQQHYRLQSKMEQILAQPFAQLLQQADALVPPAEIIPPPYSDAAGTAARRLVRLRRYDGDNADNDNDPFTGTDSGLLWVQVSIENTPHALETLVRE